ncbi:M48 family metallopeptidase [Caproicibacter sp.]|uniref:M48 family metallopeptidase n=1 Tax=Caproicibacter sp. TaxID=2814884 RepID=UPI003989BED2
MDRTIKVQRSKRKTMSLSVNRNGEIIVKAPLFLKNEVIEEFIRKHELWLVKQLRLRDERVARERALALTPEKIAALKERARTVLSERVNYYSKIMGVHPAGLKITSARTRWGSCSAINALCFSYRLILLEPDAVDYVVVHELAHIREKNHGPGFYREVEKYLPDYRRRIQLLKESQNKIGL